MMKKAIVRVVMMKKAIVRVVMKLERRIVLLLQFRGVQLSGLSNVLVTTSLLTTMGIAGYACHHRKRSRSSCGEDIGGTIAL